MKALEATIIRDRRKPTPDTLRRTGRRFFASRVGILFPALLIVLQANCARPQNAVAAGPPAPTAAQIVDGMQRHEQAQGKAILSYQATRHYSLVFRGFTRTITAAMDVEVNYDPASGKTFRIISQEGSHTLCEKVLKRALDSEREASLDKSATALSPANYKFQFAGTDRVADRPAYILNVEPVSPSKFLYRGRIWVDAAAFAVIKMDVQPAKNPSFWISRTLIQHTNQATNGLWMPAHNRSETKVRIGGTAVMTIDYLTYKFKTQPDSATMPSGSTNR